MVRFLNDLTGYVYSFSTLVTHCLCDLITIADNIHRELNNQVIDDVVPPKKRTS